MSMTTKKAPTPIDDFRNQLVRMTPELANALPSHVKPEKFQRVVMTVVQQTPDLLMADRRSLFASCTKCAADGLVPDGREAALVIFNSKRKDGSWEKRVQYMPMLAGIQKRIRNSGEIAGIEAHVVHENDEFVWKQGTEPALVHVPKFPGDRGKPVGAYAIARFKDGSDPQFEVMDIAEINRVRAVSRSGDSGPWKEWWSEMARKSVFRRLSKWLPMDADVDSVIRRDDEAGVPTTDEPSIEGQVVDEPEREPDAFQQAASGALPPPPKAAPEDELSRIRKLADESTTEDAVAALGDHPLVRKALTTGSKDLKDDVNALLADAMARVRAG